MGDKYLGAIKTARDAAALRKKAHEVAEADSGLRQRMLDAAALLEPWRWRAAAARPELADRLEREINEAYAGRQEG
jgi:hypothetical protein